MSWISLMSRYQLQDFDRIFERLMLFLKRMKPFPVVLYTKWWLLSVKETLFNVLFPIWSRQTEIGAKFSSEKYWPKIIVTERLNLTKRAIVILNNDSTLRKCICRQFQKTLNHQTFRNNDRHTISAGKSSEAWR
jgi:hypothetical protein